MTVSAITLHQARDRLRTAQAEITALLRSARNQVLVAQRAANDDLKPDALRTYRQAQIAKVQTALSPRIEQLRAQIQIDQNLIEQALVEQRPGVGNDPAALQRGLALWDQARVQVEGGKHIRTVLAAATPEMVRAIAEWAPAWLALRNASDPSIDRATTADLTPQLRAIEDRLAETHPGEYAERVREAREARTIQAAAAPMLLNVEAILAAGVDRAVPVSLDAALASHLAAHAPTLGADPEPEPANA